MDLEDSPLDLSNGMLQIAAYLQYIYCKRWYLKNYEFSQEETQDIVSWSLIIPPTEFHDAAATGSAAATCCSNQKCCSNLLQNCVHVKLKLNMLQYAAICSILFFWIKEVAFQINRACKNVPVT